MNSIAPVIATIAALIAVAAYIGNHL